MTSFEIFMARFIGRPWMKSNQYPWRPMDNRERRARWSVLYYLQFKPFEHPAKRDGRMYAPYGRAAKGEAI